MKEIWKDIEGYEGLYEVSNFGNVRSKDHETTVIAKHRTYKLPKKGRVLTPTTRRHGYLAVQLYGRGGHETRGMRTYSIHRLVAQAFIPNPNGYTEVNHKDECKTNNHVENLEWISHVDNARYGTAISRRSSKLKNGKRSRKIAQYTRDGKLVRVFPSLSEAQRQGYVASNIHKCANGHPAYSHAYGYVWRYADGENA